MKINTLRVRLGCASSALLLFLIILNKQNIENHYYTNSLRFLEAHYAQMKINTIKYCTFKNYLYFRWILKNITNGCTNREPILEIKK